MPQAALPTPAARLVDAVKRRVFESQLRRSVNPEERPSVHVGSEWGGWAIPSDVVDDSWVCYCLGAGGDVTFDLGLIAQFGATVRAFDPFEIFRRHALEQAGGDPRFTFHEVAIAAADGPITMYGRQDEVEGTISAANILRTRESFVKPGRSLPSMMRELGDSRIDLLKLDIEGSEYEVLESIDPAALGIRVLCVEFHHTSAASRAISVLKSLRADYEVVHLSSRSDITLARRQSVEPSGGFPS